MRPTTWKTLAAAALAGAALVPAAWAAPGPKTIDVDCSRHTLQDAVDAANSSDTLVVEGICMENVRIDGKRLTLRAAATPGPHGIQGVASADDRPALEIAESAGTTIDGLSIASGPASGVVTRGATVRFVDCTIDGHADDGLVAQAASDVTGLRLVVSGSGYRGIVAENASQVVCDECDLTGNSYFAVDSRLQSHVSLRDSVVSGSRGLLAEHGGYAEVDCVPLVTGHSCSVSATVTAAGTEFGGTVSLRAIGSFSGQVYGFDHGEVQILGAVQTSNGTPGFNLFDQFSTLLTQELEDETITNQPSQLTGPSMLDRFSRATLGIGTTLVGALYCDNAADAWADAAADLTGSTITGCDHAVYP